MWMCASLSPSMTLNLYSTVLSFFFPTSEGLSHSFNTVYFPKKLSSRDGKIRTVIETEFSAKSPF